MESLENDDSLRSRIFDARLAVDERIAAAHRLRSQTAPPPNASNVVLHASSFPHIIDGILEHLFATDHLAGFRLRSVCRDWNRRILRAVFARVAISSTGLGHGLFYTAEPVPRYPLCYPFFLPLQASTDALPGLLQAALPHVRALDIDGSLPRRLICQIACASNEFDTVRIYANTDDLWLASPFRCKTLVVRPAVRPAVRNPNLVGACSEEWGPYAVDMPAHLPDRLVVHLDHPGLAFGNLLQLSRSVRHPAEIVLVFNLPSAAESGNIVPISTLQLISSVFPLLVLACRSPIIAVGTESESGPNLKKMILERLQRSPQKPPEGRLRFMTRDEYRAKADRDVWITVTPHARDVLQAPQGP